MGVCELCRKDSQEGFFDEIGWTCDECLAAQPPEIKTQREQEETTPHGMTAGTVKWFSKEKGYGFITSRERGEDHFFDVRGILGAKLPGIGDQVIFEPTQGKKGLRAINVKIVRHAPSERIDDRIICPGCRKKIVPRMIVFNGLPSKSVCPYCAATVRKFTPCFIATAVYGDPACRQVEKLRRFRDERLLKTSAGQRFVRFYYRVSPSMADWLRGCPRASRIVRAVLDAVVLRIERTAACEEAGKENRRTKRPPVWQDRGTRG